MKYGGSSIIYSGEKVGIVVEKGQKQGPTRIRTGVVRIKTESDNHYTIEPIRKIEGVG